MIPSEQNPGRPAPSGSPAPIVEVRDLSRRYRGRWGRWVHALSGVSFEVRPGEVMGLLGPNGAGKTTTLKTLLGMLRPGSGSVRLFGRPVTDPAARRRLGFLTEQPYFYDYLSPLEFLDLCGVLCDMPPRERKKRSGELLDKVGLTASATLRLRRFSKGMLQRLGLAQALLHDPALVILDEPMSGLDPLGRSLVRDVLLERKQAGTTILFSSHVLPDVETLCDRVTILAGGRVVAGGALTDLAAETESGFEIVAQNLPPQLLQQLWSRGERVRPAGRRFLVETPDRMSMNRVVGELLVSGAELVSVAPVRSPLESHFLAAVAGHAGRGADAAPDRTGTDR